MVKIAKIIAKTALGDDFIPKEFRRAAAMAALSTAGETTQPGFDPIKRLRLNGILVDKEEEDGQYPRLRFTLDPVAEFLAAAAHGEECGKSAAKWAKLLRKSQAASGFQVALKLVRQAYW